MGTTAVGGSRFAAHPAARGALRTAPAAGVIAAAAVLPLLDNDTVLAGQLTAVLLYVLALVGLNVAMGYTGLLTLATGPIFIIGAYAASDLDVHRGLDFRLAIVVGTLIAGVIGMLLLAPALRLGRSAYAMVSLYMAVGLPYLLTLSQLEPITGGGKGINGVRAIVQSTDTNGDLIAQAQQIYWIVLVVVVVVAVGVWRLLHSQWGRALLAVRDDEVAAAAMGVSVLRTKLLALGVSAVLAAFAGALSAHAYASGTCVDTCTTNFTVSAQDVSLAIFFFSALVVGGSGSLWGPVLGGAAVGYFNLVAGSFTLGSLNLTLSANQRDMVFGVLLLAAVVLAPRGLAGEVRRGAGWWLRGLRRLRARAVAAVPSADAERPLLPRVAEHRGVQVDAVHVRFGGNTALDGVSLRASPARIVALVGANGSGKTTLLNAVSGLLRPERGTVLLDGADVSSVTPVGRARRGLARTFQTPRVAVHLSALENLLQGAFRRYRTGWLGLYVMPWRRAIEERALREESLRLLGAVGLAHRASTPADLLTHGERRLLEVARALVARPLALLLDEPAAGLTDDETAELARLLVATRDLGVAVVLVEHNLAFVRRVADDAVVLDRGRVIATGTPEQVLRDPLVIEAFVGVAA